MAADHFMLRLVMLLLAVDVGFGQHNPELRGVIRDPSEAPIANVALTLVSIHQALQTRSSENGLFEFAKVPADTYELQVGSPGFKTQKIPVTVIDNHPVPLMEITLPVGLIPDPETCGAHSSVRYGALKISKPLFAGQVRSWGKNKAIAHATVSLQRVGEGARSYICRTDKGGNYVFENLPAGIYNVYVSRRPYIPAQVQRILVPQRSEVLLDTTLIERNPKVFCQ